jgi:hypothetical protein
VRVRVRVKGRVRVRVKGRVRMRVRVRVRVRVKGRVKGRVRVRHTSLSGHSERMCRNKCCVRVCLLSLSFSVIVCVV